MVTGFNSSPEGFDWRMGNVVHGGTYLTKRALAAPPIQFALDDSLSEVNIRDFIRPAEDNHPTARDAMAMINGETPQWHLAAVCVHLCAKTGSNVTLRFVSQDPNIVQSSPQWKHHDIAEAIVSLPLEHEVACQIVVNRSDEPQRLFRIEHLFEPVPHSHEHIEVSRIIDFRHEDGEDKIIRIWEVRSDHHGRDVPYNCVYCQLTEY